MLTPDQTSLAPKRSLTYGLDELFRAILIENSNYYIEKYCDLAILMKVKEIYPIKYPISLNLILKKLS